MIKIEEWNLFFYSMLGALMVLTIVGMILQIILQYAVNKSIRGLRSVTQELSTTFKLLSQDHENTKKVQDELREATKENDIRFSKIETKLITHQKAIERVEGHIELSTTKPENRTPYQKTHFEE